MGLFDKPQFADGSIRELHDVAFELVGADTREVTTKFGDRQAIDLKVRIENELYTYSGFSAGILQQITNADEGDYPVVCTVETIPLKNGNHTTGLRPVGEGEDIPFAVAPFGEPQLATTDDDIPF
jgi:hypothetical protein